MVFAVMPITKASSTTLAIIFEDDTSELEGPPPYPCDNFTVWLKIFDISALWFWSVVIRWDPTILTCLEAKEGHFLKDVGPTLFPPPPIDNEVGEIPEMCCGLMIPEGATGDGILVELKFHVETLTTPAGTYIEIEIDKFLDPAEQPITIDVVTDGWLQLLPPPPTPPIARFTPETCTEYYLDADVGFVEVEFNAASSVSGFDGDDDCPIEEYRWDFDGDGVFDENVTFPIISHNYSEIGDKNVTLEVYAPGIGDVDPGYTDTDGESHIIHILEKAPPAPPVGSVIDLYTQKEPYSGKGANQPSDAFAPGEEVVLFANVTYNGEPVANVPVSFEVINSLGESEIYRTNSTGEDGIATVSFRLPRDGDAEDRFGVWGAFASVEIAEEIVTDTLTFRFGYIVEIVSLMTVNEDLQPQKTFARDSCVGMELVLRNIAMMNKTATLTVVVQDSQGNPFPDKIVFEDFVVRPGDTYFYIYCFLRIPEWASLGKAVLSASAFTAPPAEGGVAWCPGVSTSFLITWCDVAVASVVPSVWEVEVGGVVEVSVDVVNEGYEVESFNVGLYYDSFLIDECNVTDLAPGETETLFFVWNTSGVAVGDYRLKAVASVVPGETDVDDNVFEDGVVRVFSVVEVRDVAVASVVPSVWEVEVGGVVEVSVDVVNEGYEVESFNVGLYYDSFLIDECNVTDLAPGETETLFFVWNTSGVAVGDYRLKAVASVVPGETDVDDNVFEDGVVEVRKPPAPAVLPRELLVLLLTSVGAVAMSGILYLWYRKSEEMSGGRSGYEGGSSRRPFRSNPGDSGSSMRPRKSASLRLREDSSYSWKRKESDSYQKFKEVSALLQPSEGVSSGRRSRDVSPAEFGEAISSLRLRKRASGSSVFAVIRLPFVEEE